MSGEIVSIPIDGKQLPTDYYVVRIQLVHVKKRFLGLQDKQLVANAVIPNTRLEAANLTNKVSKEFEEYGVPFGKLTTYGKTGNKDVKE